MKWRKTARTLEAVIGRFALLVAVCWSLFPVYWMISTSLRESSAAFAATPQLIFKATLANYYEVISDTGFMTTVFNSLVIALVATLIALVVGSMAAYGFARFRFKGDAQLSFWVLSNRMFPPIAIVLPFFIIFKAVELLDTRLALIIVYTAFNLPMVVWVMRSFIADLPKEVEEAAFIDGCSQLQVLTKIVLPLVRPALFATGILTFTFAWNEFLFALILTNVRAQTLPVKIASFVSERGVLWGEMMAAATIAVLPILVVTLWMNRHLTRGLTLGTLRE